MPPIVASPPNKKARKHIPLVEVLEARAADSWTHTRNDKDRGEGSFNQALEGIRWLVNQGFKVSIARQTDADEVPFIVDARFREIFEEWGIPQNLAFTVFPDLGIPGSEDGSPEITENCMEKYPSVDSRAHFMCTYTRMLVKKGDSVKVYACTLVDDDPQYDLGESLAESMDERIMLRHHRCFSCYRYGASCSAPA